MWNASSHQENQGPEAGSHYDSSQCIFDHYAKHLWQGCSVFLITYEGCFIALNNNDSRYLILRSFEPGSSTSLASASPWSSREGILITLRKHEYLGD